jgi:NADH-quinone oxidoreductase subunit D
VPWDIRKANPYLVYDRLDWNLITAQEGDCYARYQVRMQEMLESWKIVKQCLEQMPKDGPINIDNPKVMYPPRERVKKSMEDLIHHFLLASEGLKTPAGEVYRPIEASKGELGFYIYTPGGSSPYRMHIRSPSFVNLQSLPIMCEGSMIADVVAVIGSLDWCSGRSTDDAEERDDGEIPGAAQGGRNRRDHEEVSEPPFGGDAGAVSGAGGRRLDFRRGAP